MAQHHPTRNVSSAAAVVDTSGLNAAAASSEVDIDDDAQSLGVIAAPAAFANNASDPQTRQSSVDVAHIPVVEETKAIEPPTKSDGNVAIDVDIDINVDIDVDNDEDNMSGDDESEYEYEDDDDAAFTGFLVTDNTYGATSSSNSNANSNSRNNAVSSSTAPARIVEEETFAASASASAMSRTGTASALVVESSEAAPRKKWREPSRAAVSMSLRAQQETSGSKRRLAQDLYRIMNQVTEEAGFSLAPQTEDSMEKWTIKLFQFDPDSNLAKDMLVVGIDHIELEMKFPEQYPFEPPFVRVVKPRFKRQTGFVMNGALCMELLTKDGWNPINDIESVIVSVRSLLVVGDGRLQAATDLSKPQYETLLATAQQQKQNSDHDHDHNGEPEQKKPRTDRCDKKQSGVTKTQVGSYSANEAQSAYSHLSDYHKKKGWDTSGWWARKG